MDCPRCKLVNPPTAKRCDCGYDFETHTVEKSYYQQSVSKEIKNGLAIITAERRATESAAATAAFVRNAAELPADAALRAALVQSVVRGALASLLAWGALNSGMWSFARQGMVEMMEKVNAPPGRFDLFLYGGAALSAFMVAAGLLGAVWRSWHIALVDGVVLIIIGAWNVLHDIMLSSALEPYGYRLNLSGGMSTIWIMVGIGQVVWGVKRLLNLGRIGASPKGLDRASVAEAGRKLMEMLQAPAQSADGRLKLSITKQEMFPIVREVTRQYTMWLLPDRAYCLESDLSGFADFPRKNSRGATISDGMVTLTADGGSRWTFSVPDPGALEYWLEPEQGAGTADPRGTMGAIGSSASVPSEVGACPKCRTKVLSNHEYAWCTCCGKSLPADIKARLDSSQAST